VLEELHVDAFHKSDLIHANKHAHEDELAQIGLSDCKSWRQVKQTELCTYRHDLELVLDRAHLALEALF